MSQHFWMMWRADCIINFVFEFFIFIYIFFKIKKPNFKNRKKFRLFFSKFKKSDFFLNFKKFQKSETNSDFFSKT